jgi:GNAT superfamily N-acetyltransferase
MVPDLDAEAHARDPAGMAIEQTDAVSDELGRRIAGRGDVEAAARTVGLAFQADPVWGPAMDADRTTLDERLRLWRLFVAAAARYPWSSIVGDGAVVSIWIPPDGIELDDAEEAELDVALEAVLGPDGTEAFHDLVARFEAHHRRDEPHAYLSLLATHPDHRGREIGMALLASDLRRIDELHVPAWLESTNPANDGRYRSVGFEPVGSFRTVDERRVITTMWRPAR